MSTIIVKGIASDGSKDYISLSGWEADRRGDIIARDTIEVAEIYGGGSVGRVTLASGNWVVDENHYIWIRAAKDNGHPGIFDSSKAYIKGTDDHPINCQIGFTRIGPGISIYNNVDTPIVGPTHGILLQNVPDDQPIIIDGMIVKVSPGAIAYRAEYSYGNTGHFIKNCIALSDTAGITAIRATNSKITVHNCTFITRAGTGLDADNDEGAFGRPAAPGIIISNNNYIDASPCYTNSGSGSFITKGNNDATSNNEATNTSLSGISFSGAGFLNATSTFGGESVAYEDLHLTLGSVLRKMGTNLKNFSPSGGIVNTDMDRHQRPNVPDIGALQFISPRTIIRSIKPSGGDFTSLSGWEVNRRGNLAIRNTIEVAEIYGGSDNTAFVMLDKHWGTNLQSYPIIRAAPGEGHSGIFDSSKAYIKNNTTTKSALYCEVGHIHIGPGISIDNSFFTGGSEDPRCINLVSIIRGGPIVIDGCCLKNTVVKDQNKMIFTDNCAYDPDLPHIVKNCQSQTAGGSTSCRGFNLHGNSWKCYNNTIYALGSFSAGISADGSTVDCENNYINSASSYITTGGGTIIKGSRDATFNTDAETPSLRSIPIDTTVFIDPVPAGYPSTSANMHLVPTSILRGSGIDLSNESPSYLSVINDFDGQIRSIPYDIGADEESSPVAPSVSLEGDLFVLF